MIVIDTHVWAWNWEKPSKLSRLAARELQKANKVLVPTICCWELAMLAYAGKFEFDRPTLEWIQQALEVDRFELAPLSPAIADQAAAYGRTWLHGDPCDRIIIATAQLLGCPLVTKDARIHDARLVQCIW